MRRVSALIALLSSNSGRGVSGRARFWSGRMAVTEYITGPSAQKCRPRVRGRQKGHADPGVASGWAVRLDHGYDRGSPGRFMDALGASGAVCPLGGVERPRQGVRFARLMQRRVRVLGGPAVRAAYGGGLSPALSPLRVWG
jgi:hypothetical protein